MNSNAFWNKLCRNAPDNPGGAPPEQTAATEAADPDYGWMPEEYRPDGQPNFDTFKAHYEDLVADSARRAEADAGVPEDGKYDFTLPEDFAHGVELPEGVKVGIDTETYAELFGELGQVLKENHIPASAAKDFAGLLTKYEAQRAAALHAEVVQDFESLGSTEAARIARVSTVQRALEAKLTPAEAEDIMSLTFSANGVKALEKLLMPRGVPNPAAPNPTLSTEGLSGYEALKAARATG